MISTSTSTSTTQRSNERAGALTLILLCLYWMWVSAWQPYTGNIGQTLHDLGSSASVHALLASIATAGLVNAPINAGQSLNQMAGLQTLGDTGRSLATGSVSTSTVEGITGRAVVSAGVSSALQGTSFQQGLVSSVVADTAAIGANAIGSTYGPTGTDPNAGLQTLAHGALGCAQGALTGGNCASGAAGAAAESVLGHVVDAAGGLPTDGNGQVTTGAALTYETGAAVLGALAGQAAGGNAQSGVNTAVNAAANNTMAHMGDYVKALNACQQNPSGAGCSTILHMSQGTAVPVGKTPSGYAVAANVGADGAPTSYVVTSPSGRQMILQPQEWGAFSQMSPGQQEAVFNAPPWSLDLTSTIIYAGNGDPAGAVANYGNMLRSPSYWVDTGTGLVMGYAGALATLPERAAGAVEGGIEANGGVVGEVVGVRFGPTNPGPLPDAVANNFRGSSYTQTTLSEPITLYRVSGGNAGEIGPYWTTIRPSGPLQAQIDLALKPEWGNTATQITTIKVPAGQTIYQGAAASQGGAQIGGGSQVFIQRVNPSWVTP